MAKYIVTSRLEHNGKTYQPDSTVELTLKEAQSIVEGVGEYAAIRPVGAPVPEWRKREIAAGKK